MYNPKPMNTEEVKLPGSLVPLIEKLAENTHDVWAAGRIAAGWTYGKERNDAQKTTPCLVPYSDLPESEKDYDRNTAIATLKAIILLGYSIEKDSA